MQLQDLFETVLTTFEVEGTPCTFVINEAKAIPTISFKPKGGSSVAQKMYDKMLDHPILTGALVGYGIAAVDQFYKNKKLTATFQAKNPSDKAFYQQLVKDLVSTGKYKANQKYVRGVTVWEINKK